MTYECPVCGIADATAYLRCNHPGCPDGRDPRAGDGNSYRYHATGLPAGGDAYRDRVRFPSIAEANRRRRLRNRKLWFWGACIVAAYVAYCFAVSH